MSGSVVKGLDLCEKYRPKSLSDVFGQGYITGFFKAVVKSPEISPRYFLLSGSHGIGKTSIARAFAYDLIGGDYKTSPCYTEFDSSDSDMQKFDLIRMTLEMDMGDRWRVMVLDEAHLLDMSVQQKFLKYLEDFKGRVFIFFCTTNPEKLFPPVVSRLYQFSLETFTSDQLRAYGKDIMGKEGFIISDKALQQASLFSQGHLRDMLKQCELIYYQGEEEYLKSYSTVWKSIEDLFFSDKPLDEIVSQVVSFPAVVLRGYFTYFFREEVISPKAERYNTVYPVTKLVKLFMMYLKLLQQVKETEDFYSFIYVFGSILREERLK